VNNLQAALNLLLLNLPDPWWSKFDLSVEGESVQNLMDLFEEENNDDSEEQNYYYKLQVDFIDHLNFAILRGEHVEFGKQDNLIEEIKSIFERLRSAPSNTSLPQQQIEKLQYLVDEFLEPLEYAINLYSEFLSVFFRRINHVDKKFIFSFNNIIRRTLEQNNIDEEFNHHLQLLGVNMALAEIDQSLHRELEAKQLFRLYQIIVRLDSSLQIRPYASIIRLKADYLRNKLLLRGKETRLPDRVFTIEDGQEVEITKEKVLCHPELDKWLIYAFSHYELGAGWKAEITDEFEKIKSKRHSDCTVLELYKSLKYNKDVKPDEEKVKEIHDELLRRSVLLANDKLVFNTLGGQININYSANILFSVQCKDDGAEVAKLDQVHEEVMKIQNETGIKNFFPHYKYIEFLVKKLQSLHYKTLVLERIQECRDIIEKLKELIKLYEGNVEWSQNHYPYVYQLPFKECCVSIDDPQIDRIFIYSSMFLPLPRNKYVKELESYRNEINRFEASIEILSNVETKISELEKIKGDLTDLQKKGKEQEIKTIELVSIFTAIISFAAGSLPTFLQVETAWDAATFMLALSTSLAVFVLLMSFMLRWQDVKRKGVTIVVGLAITAILWILVTYCSDCI
jgi:hypothetical protein